MSKMSKALSPEELTVIESVRAIVEDAWVLRMIAEDKAKKNDKPKVVHNRNKAARKARRESEKRHR